MAKDFFISYSNADRLWAEWIAWVLEESGYAILLDSWDFRPGSNFVIEMQRAASEAERTLVVLSPDYLRNTAREWNAALAQAPKLGKQSLLPVRVRECKVGNLLTSRIYVDLVGLNEVEAKEALLQAVTGREKPWEKPRSVPRFPGSLRYSSQEAPRFPDALPPVWQVPFGRNEFFTGRVEELSQLRQLLLTGHAASHKVVIQGVGGIGKTQLALEYAYRFKANYQVVLWIDSETASILTENLTDLTKRLGLQDKANDSRIAATEALTEWLSAKNDWLIVFDGAPTREEIADLLVSSLGGHVIVTSRNYSWDGVAGVINLSEMTPDEAIRFILRRTDQSDETSAKELAQELGYLPLALDIAGSYVAARREPLSVYLRRYRKSALELYKSDSQGQILESILEVSIETVEHVSPTAAALLNVCAFLAPDDVPQEMLIQGARFLPAPLAAAEDEPRVIAEAVSTLATRGLGRATTDALSIHRLLHAVIRRRLSDEDLRKWAEVALAVVSHAFPSGKIDALKWDEAARLLPHALVVTDHAETLGVAPATTARLLNQVGLYLHGRAQFKEAEQIFRRILAMGGPEFGPESANTAVVLTNLAGLLHDIHQMAEAEQLYLRALYIYKREFDPRDPNLAQSINNLAGLLYETNRLEEAEQLYRRALQINSNEPTLINNLAGLLQDTGRFTEAKVLYRRALDIETTTMGPNHPKIAGTLGNLAGLLYHTGELTEAEQLYQQALAIDERNLGPDHPNVARDLNNLAQALKSSGRVEEAEPLMRRALVIDEQTFGPDHPSVATDLNNLALLLKDTNRFGEADPLMRRALGIDEKSLGPEHPKVAIRLNNLAQLLKNTNHLEEAEPLMRRALAIDEQIFGPDHPNVARVLINLALLLKDTDRLEEAEPLMRRALTISERSWGPGHPSVVTILSSLTELLETSGRLEDAEALKQRAPATAQSGSESTLNTAD